MAVVVIHDPGGDQPARQVGMEELPEKTLIALIRAGSAEAAREFARRHADDGPPA